MKSNKVPAPNPFYHPPSQRPQPQVSDNLPKRDNNHPDAAAVPFQRLSFCWDQIPYPLPNPNIKANVASLREDQICASMIILWNSSRDLGRRPQNDNRAGGGGWFHPRAPTCPRLYAPIPATPPRCQSHPLPATFPHAPPNCSPSTPVWLKDLLIGRVPTTETWT